MRQKASQSHGLQHPADLGRPAPHFGVQLRGQGLDRFALSNEHKGRVLLISLQRLSTLTARFAFHVSSFDSQKLRYFTLSPEHKKRVLVQEFQYLRF